MHATSSPQPAPPARIGRALARLLSAARSRHRRNIEAISASPLFAHGAAPRPAPDNVDARTTTTASHPGRDTDTVAFGVTCPGRPPMRFRITPSLSVLEHTA